ncbi:AI-2E family transporter [Ancylobacter terrae]|uniref:AI-2E family transporter n=1 Tax=Ancylobacter sp. sgz301288 TaxID=3342077 RepID=UPI003859ACCE
MQTRQGRIEAGIQVRAPRAENDSPVPVGEARNERMWRRMTQVAIISTGLIAFGAVLVMARAVLIPIVAAVIIGSVIGPAIEALSRRGIPTIVSSVLLVVILVASFYGVALLLAAPLADWVARGPEIGAQIRERFESVQPAISAVASLIDTIESIGRPEKPPLVVDVAGSAMLQNMVSVVTPAIGEFILFFGSLLFFLAGRAQIKRKLVQAMTPRPARLAALRIFRAIEERLGTYLVTATFINIGLGIATGLMTWAVGLPNPVLWAAIACVFNYIPYIGPAATTAILLVAGLISFPTILAGIVPAAIFLLFTSVEGQILMPLIVGRRVSLNPFAVFLSMAVWTWLWGPVGTFLAVPLLIAAQAFADELAEGRRLNLPG